MSRQNFRILAAIGLALLALVVSIPLVAVAELRAAQEQSRQELQVLREMGEVTKTNSEANRTNVEYIKDCATPTGQCYKDSARSREAVASVERLSREMQRDAQLLAERIEVLGVALCKRQGEFPGVTLKTPCPPPLPPSP